MQAGYGVTALSAASRQVVQDILAQLEHYEQSLQGVEVTILEKELVYRGGQFVVEETRQEQRTLGQDQTLDDLLDLRKLLSGPGHTFRELPARSPDELRVRITPSAPSAMGESVALTMILSKVPARLLRIETEAAGLPVLFKALIKSQAMEITFDYVRGVPVPTLVRLHLLSRGVGALRFGAGSEIEVRYKTQVPV